VSTRAGLPRWRIATVFALLIIALTGVVVKAGRLQLVLGDDLRSLAENQYLRRVPVAAPRGSIFDRHLRPLAVSLPAWSVGARPALVEDKAAAAAALAGVLGMSATDVRRKLDSDAKFLWLKRRATGDLADGVRSLAIPGIELTAEMRRTWPHKALAGQLLGLVDVDGRARGGVEQALDASLQGRSSSAPAIADNRGDRVALAGGLDVDLLEGDDVVLTIDMGLQQVAEDALADVIGEFAAAAAWAIALDARTGAIRAVAHAPSFNPNAPDPTTARNKALAEAFEPGSIFKVATFAAALDEGVLTPADRIYCENGRYQLGTHVIHDTHKAEWLTATEVFARSSNIGTLKIGQRVGEDRLKKLLVRYGFGAQPGTGLLEETGGRLPPSDRWGETRLATVSFGHGLLVSALQMASFAQAVGHGGVRMRPYLVDVVRSPAGDTVQSAPVDVGERIMGAAAARALTEMMKSVVREGGTGPLAAIPGIAVAGKTGTAEKVDPATKRYSRDLHLSSFVGFAPADDPRIVVIVVVDNPRHGYFGGDVAAPAWRRIVEHALVDEGVLSTGVLAAAAPASPARVEGGGGHVEQLGETAEHQPAFTTSLAVVAIDLRGLGARAAVRRAEEAGIEVIVDGSGVVVDQKPAPGKPVPPGGKVRVRLASVDDTPIVRRPL
jgi:cell division protein FtsI (penicillin-binding protein 3)